MSHDDEQVVRRSSELCALQKPMSFMFVSKMHSVCMASSKCQIKVQAGVIDIHECDHSPWVQEAESCVLFGCTSCVWLAPNSCKALLAVADSWVWSWIRPRVCIPPSSNGGANIRSSLQRLATEYCLDTLNTYGLLQVPIQVLQAVASGQLRCSCANA